ncbi:RNA polymerase sigma factor [Umezawaea sp. Da 62-37]|uniref:RNA polymerase sigma factor n=1 Tax=Umezawaea sp. Da 62-37 TaxID=3075927 RepID=UPI0028F74451|nr:RNA polymerase sigma factor [Umezawaea sp. Da 62-37]WNV89646.1 RNA polymerase sigma factor [Umezawaea sp. Da 62-37]
MTPTDAELIERSWHEPEHFATIFDRHAPHIQRYLARRLGGEAADDLVAETFLAAFAKRKSYDGGRPDARPWLYGIATHVVGQHRRTEVRRYRLREAIAPAPAEACHADRVAADVTAQSLRASLASALASLATPDRDVLLLIAWEQLTYDEVASALKIPVGTVRSRLNRARRKVREVLGAQDHNTVLEELLSNG